MQKITTMLYAYILQLKNWVHWHIYRVKAWLEEHPDRYHPGREQSTKDQRSLFSLFYELQIKLEK